MKKIINKIKEIFKKKPKTSIGILTLVIGLTTIAIMSVSALTLQKVSGNDVLPADYGWNFKFMKGVTTVTTGGMTNYAEDTSPTMSESVTARLTSDNQKGKIWIRYNNVGVYNDKIIDLKITLKDWDYLESSNSVRGYPTVAFPTNGISVNMTYRPQIQNPIFNFSFYEHGTNNLIKIKGHSTFTDIDGSSNENYESAIFKSGFLSYYITNDSKIVKLSNNEIRNSYDSSTNPDDKFGWLTFLYDTTSFEFSYNLMQGRKDSPEDWLRNFFTVGISSEAVAPFDIAKPKKTVNVTEITNTDSFEYTISHYVPGESSSFKYYQYYLEDVIPSVFEVKSYSVIDDYGIERKDWFDYSIESSTNKIKFNAKTSSLSAKEFYNNTYNFKINVSKKSGYDMSEWYSNSKSIIPNTAKLIVGHRLIEGSSSNNQKTNTVNVAAYQKIYTSATNATITPASGTKVVSGSTKDVVFSPNEGYYISKITIDGTSYTYSSGDSITVGDKKYKIIGDTITFENIAKDHTVSVEASTKYKVTTSIDHGTITPNITKIAPSSNKEVTFTPSDGYYIKKITIDGTSYSYSSGTTITIGSKNYNILGDTYTFSNIQKNHTISVETATLFKVTTSIDHGTITPNITKITPSSNKEVTFTPSDGYYIKKITIDGTSYSYSSGTTITIGSKNYNILGDTYTFNNIQTNHTIDIETTPLYKITTKIDHGTITDNITKIMPKTNKSITYTPSKGYYVSEILIDGNKSSNFTKTGGTYTFNTISSDHTIEVKTLPYKFAISGKKEDSATKSTPQGDATLQGAKIGVYYKTGWYDNASEEPYENNELVCEATTDLNGNWSCPGTYPVGKYVIKETKAPEGYNISTEEYSFTHEDNTSVTHTIKDTIITSEVGVLKKYKNQDGTTAPEPNAKFNLVSKSTNKIIGNITTGTDGRGTIKNVPYGEYKICQTAGDKNYWMQNECKNVSVNTNGAQVILTLFNEEVVAHLRVTKLDKETKRQVRMYNIKFEIYDSNNNRVCQNGTCQFATNNDGVAMTLSPLSHGSYTLVEVNKKMDGYLYNNARIPFTIDSEQVYTEDSTYGLIVDLTFENTPVKGKIIINKYGQKVAYKDNKFVYTSSAMPDIKFGLYAKEDIYDKSNTLIYSANELVATMITDNKGHAEVNNLPLGKYYAKELKTAYNHVLDTREINFELKYLDQSSPTVITSAAVNNFMIKGSLKIKKIDNITKAKLEGAEFEIHYLDDDKDYIIHTGVTNKTGEMFLENLPYGQYYFIEKNAPNKYIHKENKNYFDISHNNKVVEITVENEKYSDLTILKKNVKGEALQGVAIDIYNITNSGKHKLFYEGITNEEGKIHVGTIPKGNYYYVEKSTLDGYVLDKEQHDFTIDQNSKSYSYELVNEHYSNISITKTDINKKPLKGVKINIYNTETNELFYEGITDEEGKIFIGLIPKGNYFYQEIATLPGYVLDSQKYDIIIDKNDSSFNYEMINEKYSNLTITKTDVNKKPLKNVKINIYNTETNELFYEGLTDESGEIYVDEIPIGNYYFIETKAPDNYQINEEKHPFTVNENGIHYEATISNEKYSTVTFYKKDLSDETKLLAGATICVYKEDGTELACLVTNEEGYATMQLTIGKYYYKETIAPENYEIDPEVHYFEVTQEGSTFAADVYDKFIVIEVPKTDITTTPLIVGVIGAILGCGILLFSKKKK